MNIIKKAVYLLITLSLFISTSQAQVGLKKLGQSTMNFLKVSISPKYAAMGDAPTAIVDDARSMFYNPAGLAGVSSGINAFVSNTQWIADINYIAGGLAKSFGNLGTFGVNFLSVDYGDIQGAELLSQADPQGYQTTGKVNFGAYAVGLSYARQISNQFSMGGQIQYVGQNLGKTELAIGTAKNAINKVTLNFGVKFFPGYKSFRFAMSIRNFSSAAKYQEISAQLPLIFRVGVGIDLLDLVAPSHNSRNSLLVSTEFLHPNNYTERINIGGEYKLAGLIALRGGYEFNRDLAAISAGFGVTPTIGGNPFELNYSYSAFDVFSGVNRFSVVASF